MTTDRIDRTAIPGVRGSVANEISPLLPRILQPFISTSHPASLLLFDRDLTFWRASWQKRPFLILESAGYFFLPAPPPWTLPGAGHPEPGSLGFPDFWSRLAQTLLEWNNGIPARLDSLPPGLSAEGFQSPQTTETEYIFLRSSWETLHGREFRAHRWERNRLRREHPALRAIPWSGEYLRPAKKLIERFIAFRRSKNDGHYSRLLLEDQYRAHEKALELSGEIGLTGLLLLSGTDLLGIGWFALIPEEASAICFLEARQPEMDGIPVSLTQAFFRLFPRYGHLNIQGGSGILEIDQAKKLDSPQACSQINSQSLSSATSF